MSSQLCDMSGCGNQVFTVYRKYPKTKISNNLYFEYIDSCDNIIFLCKSCSVSKKLPVWSEKDFCDHFGIEIRSKKKR